MIIPSPAFFPLSVHPADILIDTLLAAYSVSLLVLLVIAGQGLVLLYFQTRSRSAKTVHHDLTSALPVVTVQLPLYNEQYVVERLLRAVCSMDYPKEALQVQVLDDSNDETTGIVDSLVREYREKGHDVIHIKRGERRGFKAGALREGLRVARGEFIAIFDADFIPRRSFLRDTLPLFSDASVGMVQTRWEHLNETYSALTRVQAFAFDGHFAMEQQVRCAVGHFLTFNGTGGIWRTRTIIDAGGWHDDTLTEDLDLSFRAQLRGWRMVFLNEITTPGELPVDFNSLRKQQYRWTKGYIETARKIIPRLWRSPLPLHRKVLSTLHLSGNIAFPFMLVVAVLNAPIAMIKASGGHDMYFLLLSVFVLGFASTFLYFLQSQRLQHKDWGRRMLYFPLFLAGSMGLAVSNTKAVLEGLMGRRGEFERTPKFAVGSRSATWSNKHYAQSHPGKLVVAEILLGSYCFFGVVFSLYQLDFFAMPFQLLFAAGFALVAWTSMKHATSVRRARTTHES